MSLDHHALRLQIREEIASIQPCDSTEKQVLSDALAWVDGNADLFRTVKPATPPKHLVSYFVVVDGDHVLLVDHIKSGLWLPSGGHVEPGEHPRTTVAREIVEELGIPADFVWPEPQFITATTTVGLTAGHVDVSLWYVVRGDRSQHLDFDLEEFTQVRWFTRKDVPKKGTEPELGRFLKKLEGALPVK